MLIDMDYFFVACEEIRNPSLRSQPTIVGAHPKEGRGRGVVMTCNYVARKYGIHSAMPISTAYKLKPDAKFLPMDYLYYEQKSKEVMAIMGRYSEKIEQVSIDEAFLDVSGKGDNGADAVSYAEKIKETIRKEAKLPCTIGISNSKLISKMACESAKPDGLRLVAESEITDFIKDMSVTKLYGVGGKTAERLERMGYRTIGELSRANVMQLMAEFGSFGLELHNHSLGIDESAVEGNYEVKSIGREKTFDSDTNDDVEILSALKELSKGVMSEVESQGFSFKVVTIKRRYSDFSEQLKSRSIRPSNSLDDMETAVLQLYKAQPKSLKKIRKIGVRVSGLTRYKSQKRLF